MLDSEILTINDNHKLKELERHSNSRRAKSSITFTINSKIEPEYTKEILFLINAGYNKQKITKVFLLLKPKNINEAVYYLSKENNLYQLIFYPSNNCEICDGKKEEHTQIMINPNRTILSINEENNSVDNEIKRENNKDICKVCEEEIENEEIIKRNRCKYCKEIFCDFCYYNHLKESIKSAKVNIYCPNCNNILKEGEIIQKIYETSDQEKKEAEELINIFKKNIKNFEIINNKNIRFCPIIGCDSFAVKEKDIFVKCEKGHKFCFNCEKQWHKNRKCENEEEIEKSFEEFKKKLNTKECPKCTIISIKNEGCNHITCTYCKSNWCWICEKQIQNPNEHYKTNPNNSCYNKMLDDNFNSNNFCSKCLNELHNLTRINNCEHFICQNCLENIIKNLKADTFIKEKIRDIKCPIENCENGIINNQETLDYLKIHNKNLYKVIKRNTVKNFDFSIKEKFFHFNFKKLWSEKICDSFRNCIGLQKKVLNCDSFFCNVLIKILFIFQLLILSPIFSIGSIITNFQTISRKLYYHEIKEFMGLIGYNYLSYLNYLMFEILNVVNFFQILLINIVYIFIAFIIEIIR